MFVIKSSLGNFLRSDADGFVTDDRKARTYATADGAAEAIVRYWGSAGPRVFRAVPLRIRREERD